MNPRDVVQVPAIGLMVVGAIGVAFNLFFSAFMILGAGLGSMGGKMSKMGVMVQGAFGVMFYGFLAILALMMFVGGLKMRNLSSFPLALTGCIIAVLPCYHNCCILGMVFGIWGLVVLFRPDVQAGFKHVKDGGDLDQYPNYLPSETPGDGDDLGPPPTQ